MDLLNSIQQKKDELSLSEQKVAQMILNHPEFVENETISRLAQYADTSTSAVLRFCQAMGYNGFKDFKYAFTQDIHKDIEIKDEDDHLIQSIADNALLMKRFPKEYLKKLADDIIHASSIYIYGVYYSALAAMKLSMRLEDLGIRSFVSADTVSGTHRANTVDSDSVLITFSVGGNGRSYRNILDTLPTSHSHFYLITSAPHNRVSQYYDHIFILPPMEHLTGDLNEQTAQFIFIELLIQEIRKIKK